MIFSTVHKFIFIHVPKAAGTSVNAALSIHDLFYPIKRADLAARRVYALEQGQPEATAAFEVHTGVRQCIAALGVKAYRDYFSFAFVRNPWDVAVSWFHYRLINSSIDGHAQTAAAGSFERYVRECLAGPEGARWVGLQHPFVTDTEGALAVKTLGRYENLVEDFQAIVDVLKVQTLPLDHFNQSYHGPWAQLYTRETFAIVRDLVKRDADLLGYPDDPAAYGIKT